jgi:hypothetical protein
MRAALSAVRFSHAGRDGRDVTVNAARRITALTHGDRAAVTGGLAGAVYGSSAFPASWAEALHVPLPGFGGRLLRAAELGETRPRLDRPGSKGRAQSPAPGRGP